MYECLAEILKNEITNLASDGSEIRVIASADLKYAIWKSSSTLASFSTFAKSWVTAENYAEHGLPSST